MEGIIFDLSRNAVHDGPGIRTTVFLKGCPLRCWWCHNPESQCFQPELSLQNGETTVIGKATTVEEIMSEVVKDKLFYDRTNGGLTISGGEPLAQSAFTLALLKAAKQAEIHTCLDTTGYATQDVLAMIMPCVDLFLFDYKMSDEAMHKKVTGVSSKRILANLNFLLMSGQKVILRCPIVPGINDTEAHFKEIGKLLDKYPSLSEVHLMPYHNWGNSKYESIGKEVLFSGSIPEETEKSTWINIFSDWGYSKVRIG